MYCCPHVTRHETLGWCDVIVLTHGHPMGLPFKGEATLSQHCQLESASLGLCFVACPRQYDETHMYTIPGM